MDKKLLKERYDELLGINLRIQDVVKNFFKYDTGEYGYEDKK